MDEELQEIVGKTVMKVEKGEFMLYVTFDDGSVLRVSAGGHGEIWINADVRVS